VNLVLAEAPNVADWISALGQALGALFTAVAVVVALRIAHRDYRERTKEGHARAKAQAKLVLLDGPEVVPWSSRKAEDEGKQTFAIGVLNIGGQPILGITFEVAAQSKRGIVHLTSAPTKFLDPARHDVYEYCRIETTTDFQMWAWRVFWEDPDGLEWEVAGTKETGRTLQPKTLHWHNRKSHSSRSIMKIFGLMKARQ